MGKFYELFEMDAHMGAEVLGLSYMKASSMGGTLWIGFTNSFEMDVHAGAEVLGLSYMKASSVGGGTVCGSESAGRGESWVGGLAAICGWCWREWGGVG